MNALIKEIGPASHSQSTSSVAQTQTLSQERGASDGIG
jgi:hypothetical protein